jgi:hypothetical protein
MERSDVALRRARSAYERAHILAGLRGIAITTALVVAAIGLHRTTAATWLVTAALAATLATLGWRGGAWRRGAAAGALAGLPVFVAPALHFVITHGGHCPQCAVAPSLMCMALCVGTSLAAGMLVGHVATRDTRPRIFALGAIASALLTGLLGCGTFGFVGALGVGAGLVAGGVTGWVVAIRTARA